VAKKRGRRIYQTGEKREGSRKSREGKRNPGAEGERAYMHSQPKKGKGGPQPSSSYHLWKQREADRKKKGDGGSFLYKRGMIPEGTHFHSGRPQEEIRL